MTRKELFLIIAVIAGLFLTAMSFTEKNSFDCYQPMFSRASTCSVNGQTCILVQKRSGLPGLINDFKGLFTEKKETPSKCKTECPLKLSDQSMHQIDSINHIHP